MLTLDLATALDLTTRIVACALAIWGLETLSVREHFGHGGIFALPVVAPLRNKSPLLSLIDTHIQFLIALQIAGGILLALAGPFALEGRLALAVVLAASTMVRGRRNLGGDGAEQMATIVLVSAALAVLPSPSPERVTLAVLFIAAQLTLSYVTAGTAKLISPLWRSGGALPAILSTYGHGSLTFSRLLYQQPLLGFLGSWSVIGFECLFPLLIWGPSWLVVMTLAAGFTFHCLCAVTMGLNSFLWSFPATYLCVIASISYLTRTVLAG